MKRLIERTIEPIQPVEPVRRDNQKKTDTQKPGYSGRKFKDILKQEIDKIGEDE